MGWENDIAILIGFQILFMAGVFDRIVLPTQPYRHARERLAGFANYMDAPSGSCKIREWDEKQSNHAGQRNRDFRLNCHVA